MFSIKNSSKIDIIKVLIVIIFTNVMTFFITFIVSNIINRKQMRSCRIKNNNIKLIKIKLAETKKKLASIDQKDKSNLTKIEMLQKEEKQLTQNLDIAKKVSSENVFFLPEKSMKTMFKTSISVQRMHEFVLSPHITAKTPIKSQYVSRNGKFVWFFNHSTAEEMKNVENGKHIASMWNLVKLDHSNAHKAQEIMNSGDPDKIAKGIKSGALVVIMYRMNDTSWGYRFMGKQTSGSWSGLIWKSYPNGKMTVNIGQICVDSNNYKCKK